MRLAAEISMVENVSDMDDFDQELEWNPQNLIETEETIRMMKDLENNSRLRKLFGSAMKSDGHSRVTSTSKKDQLLNRRPSGRGREQKIKDAVTTISGKLRWYQNKIAQTIESTNEDDSLAHLLQLNDRVSTLFSKTEEVIHRQSSSYSNRNSESTPTGSLYGAGSRSGSRSESIKDKQVPKLSPRHTHSDEVRLSDIPPIVYALSRGSNRVQTLGTVNKLIALCNFGGDVRLAAVKEMMSAGALQSLLSTLTRAGDWPEVELQISKVISVLVTYEDDWALLQRSAYVILSSLYTLQLKSNARTLIETTNRETDRQTGKAVTLNVSQPPGPPSLQLPVSGLRVNRAQFYELEPISAEPVSELEPVVAAVEPEIPTRPRSDTSSFEDQAQDVRALVSAAIAKLTLVLSCEWNNVDSPLSQSGNFGNKNSKIAKSSSNSTASNNGRIEYIRNISGDSNIKQQQSGGGRARSHSNADGNKILEILLNLIVTMSESSLQSLHHHKEAAEDAIKLSAKESQDSLFSLQSKSTSSLNLSVSTTPGIILAGKGVSFSSLADSVDATTPLRGEGIAEMRHKDHAGLGMLENASSHSSIQIPDLSESCETSPKPPIQVDNATVLCSAALSNLAEIPQCRPDLVTGGALKIIKSWLEIGVEVLAHARHMCFQDHILSSPGRPSTRTRDVNAQFVEFMKLYGTAYELISNAAAAIMYLSGGCDVRFQHSGHQKYNGSGSNPLEGNGGRDYIVGWIDAQIIAEGIPAVIVRLISTAVEDFALVPDLSTTTRSVLPAAVGMHLSQTLYQLCSRVQNRQQLKITKIPNALCILFENVVSQVRSITYSQNHKQGDSAAHDSIYACIFEFSGIYYQNTHGNGGNTTNRDREPPETTTASHQDIVQMYSTSIDEHNISRLSVSDPRAREGSNASRSGSAKHGSPTPAGEGNSKGLHVNTSLSRPTSTKGVPRLSLSDHASASGTSSMSVVMSSIASSCLDALTYFFSDEVAKLPYTLAVNRAKSSGTLPIPPPMASPFNTHSLAGSSLNNSGHTQLTQSLIDLMCSPRIIDAILLASSYLPRGNGRLATIRIISSLTEFPQSLKALYEGSVVDVLVLISSEAEEIKVPPVVKPIGIGAREVTKSSLSLSDKMDDERNSSGAVIPTPRPNNVARDVSSSSTMSALSTNSQHRNKRKGESFSSFSGGGHCTPNHYMSRSTHSCEDIGEDDCEDDDSAGTTVSTVATEETLVVCYCLANLCEASPVYATRMFNSGLFMIMIKLICAPNMEVQRQALRCMSAMCPVISSESIEKAIFVKPKKSNSIFFEALTSLTVALKSPSILVQKGAVNTISQLALINEQIQDSIVEGPLRSIISLLVNPKNDRETRAAAEEVLKNVGFLGGVKDFELCGFDFEILRDWYAMKRSLKPQDLASSILKEWIENLFSEAQATNNDIFNLHHQHNNAELSAHGLANEAVTILQTGSSSASSQNIVPQNGSNNTSSNNLNSAAGGGTPVNPHEKASDVKSPSTPSLQRSFTDGIFKLLQVPFCGPKILRTKSGGLNAHGHSRFHSSSDESDYQHHHRRPSRDEDGPPGGNTMNRSIHPVSPVFHTPILSALTANNSGAQTPTGEEQYDWLDRPPSGVTNLYDLFYSSKLQQSILMDVTSLGVCVNTSHLDFADDRSRSQNTETVEEYLDQCDSIFLMPRPHEVSAILLPSRVYQSFARVGRVLEKMIEYSNTVNSSTTTPQPVANFAVHLTTPIDAITQLWSLTFRESEFDGDFHTSLLSTLRKSPQICALSFDSSRVMEEDALLGHLVGQVPPSVRFLSFRSTLSRESIQALCILIRTQNAAFIAEATELHNPHHHSRANSGFEKHLRKSTTDKHLSFGKSGGTHATKIDISTSGKFALKEAGPDGSSRGYSKGLIGLALTHFVLEATEINHIVELLQLNTKTALQRGKSFNRYSIVNRDSSVSKRSGGDNTPLSPIGKHDLLKGLRFIDLSYNSLHDAHAAKILQAAMTGPLEGLELCGNAIHKGKQFLEVCEGFLVEKMATSRVRLRYLGLSHNNLSSRTVTGLLQILCDNDTVTHLDLSSNEVDHSAATNELLRTFLICNVGMRSLNLCYNRLNTDSFKEIHLGLLENSTMLLLPLIRLRENRLLYKMRCKIPDTLNLKGASVASVSAVNLTNERHSPVDLGDGEEQIQTAIAISALEEATTKAGLTPVATAQGGNKHHLHLSDPSSSPEPKLAIALPFTSTTASGSSMTVNTSEQFDSKADVYRRSTNHSGSDVLLDSSTPHSGTFGVVDYSPHSTDTTFTPTNNHASFPVASSSIGSLISNSMIAGLSEENVKMHNQQLSGAHMSNVGIASPQNLNDVLSVANNTLNVLFSAPLAGFDRQLKPHPLEVLDYTAEREILIQVFKEVHRDVSVHFDFATTDSLRTALSFGCKALHFSGHGIPKGLCFEDGRSGLQVIRVPQLKSLLGAGGLNLEFVFVSACYSKEIGEAFVKAGVAHVVCVNVDSKIQDAAAIAFTRAFYVAFLSGRTVRDSFDIAKEALKVSPYVPDSVLEGDKFILLPDGTELLDPSDPNAPVLNGNGEIVDAVTGAIIPRPQHNKSIFVNRSVANWPSSGHCTMGPNHTDVSHDLLRNRLPAPPADFEGREVVMHSLISSIFDRRLVSLVGEDGVGKTSVASCVCKYIADRKIFADGVVFFRAKGLQDYH
eukprot:gene22664-28808_t